MAADEKSGHASFKRSLSLFAVSAFICVILPYLCPAFAIAEISKKILRVAHRSILPGIPP
jgi:hypothetical protein